MNQKTACDQFGHNWYAKKFGGAVCGRCGKFASQFRVVNGKPEVHNH